ncbi:MAG: hypothetical protein PHC64_09045 [Candidatus Gastranaerophilales bacterium]|nr:hypothetical protein [Candidatus Gastranaerophilales bacterium]
MLIPNAADAAEAALHAATTKAALAETLAGTSDAFAAVTGSVDVAARAADMVTTTAVATDTLDAVTTAVEHKSWIAEFVGFFADILP